ncbi:MAG: vWA domain-containing protein, partial [Pseudomonadota bacterium]
TGQTINYNLSGLEYDLPDGLGVFTLRITSDISAHSESIKLDNVKITAKCPPKIEIDAADDSIRVLESETEGDLETLESGDDSILDNDTENGAPYEGDVVTVNGTAANVGEFVELAGGGRVKINADGTVDFDADGDFDALNAGESAVVTVNYTIGSESSIPTKTNLLFVVDESGSTLSNGLPEGVFVGTGVGDQNGDGRSDTPLDAEIAAVKAAVADLLASGVDPSSVKVGLVSFNTNAVIRGTFALDDPALITALENIRGDVNGWTDYDDALDKSIDWFNSRPADGAENRIVFLSDGVPRVPNGTIQDNSVYGPEVATLTASGGINADIEAIGVGGNAELGFLNDLDNTGGAERVTDAATLMTMVSDAAQIVGASDQATVTITVLGENDPLPVLDAVDDFIKVGENEGQNEVGQEDIFDSFTDTTAEDSILDNDTEDGAPYAGDVIEVDGDAANVGAFVQLAEGGRIRINADGTVDFDTDGDRDGVSDFEALGNGETQIVTVDYTIASESSTTTLAERTITFDDLATRTDISNAIDGVTITATRRDDLGQSNPDNAARIYDTRVSGQDNDLQASASGPLSKVLIIQEDNGSDTRPDDNFNGGTVRFDFDAPQIVHSVDLIDTEERDGTRPAIVFTFADGGTQRVDAAVTGDTEATTQIFNNGAGFANVISMEFEFIGSAGIDNLVIAEETTTGISLTDIATVNVSIMGENVLVDGDEATRVDEDAGAVTLTNVLENTDDPETGAPSVLSVAGSVANLGATIAGSNGGVFTIDAQGNASFNTNGEFDDLATGQSAVTTVTYTVTDATGDTDVSNYTVIVDGKDEFKSLEGTITTGGPGNQSLSFVIDHSFNMFRRQASESTSDPNGDNSNRVIDAVLDQIIDKVSVLDAAQQVHFALTGDDSLVGSVNTTAGALLEAKSNGTLATIFNQGFAQPDGAEVPDNLTTSVDFNFGLKSARDFLTTPSFGFGANGATEDEIVIITASDGTVGIDLVTGDPIPPTSLDEIVAELTDSDGINATIDVVLINSGLDGETITEESFLNSTLDPDDTFDPLLLIDIDSDGEVRNVGDADDYGLDDVVANTSTRSAGEVVSITFGGQTFSVVDGDLADTNADPDIFEFVLADLDADPSGGIIVGVSTDSVPETVERTETVFPAVDPDNPDAFNFTLMVDPDPLVGGA